MNTFETIDAYREWFCEREKTRVRRLEILRARRPVAWFRWEIKYAMRDMDFGPSPILEMLHSHFLKNAHKVYAA